MKKISVKRKNELTKIYSNADMIGRAFVEYFIEKEKARKNPDFQMTLNAEEISFIRSNLKTEEDKTVFDRYLLIKRILANYAHWIEYYQQIFYHGLFRALSIIQPVESDLEKLRFLRQPTHRPSLLQRTVVRWTLRSALLPAAPTAAR